MSGAVPHDEVDQDPRETMPRRLRPRAAGPLEGREKHLNLSRFVDPLHRPVEDAELGTGYGHAVGAGPESDEGAKAEADTKKMDRVEDDRDVN